MRAARQAKAACRLHARIGCSVRATLPRHRQNPVTRPLSSIDTPPRGWNQADSGWGVAGERGQQERGPRCSWGRMAGGRSFGPDRDGRHFADHARLGLARRDDGTARAGIRLEQDRNLFRLVADLLRPGGARHDHGPGHRPPGPAPHRHRGDGGGLRRLRAAIADRQQPVAMVGPVGADRRGHRDHAGGLADGGDRPVQRFARAGRGGGAERHRAEQFHRPAGHASARRALWLARRLCRAGGDLGHGGAAAGRAVLSRGERAARRQERRCLRARRPKCSPA